MLPTTALSAAVAAARTERASEMEVSAVEGMVLPEL